MKKRNFELIRLPDRIGSSFLFNNVRVRYVATCPETGISFYANNGRGGVVGIRVYPDGRKVLENATTDTTPNSKRPYDAKRKQRYLKFKDAFGFHKHIYAAHAVYIAWRNEEIPADMTIDHIDGCTTNNFIGNLRCVSKAINNRDSGFLRKLRNKGLFPIPSSHQPVVAASPLLGISIPRWMLLRYFDRMALLKPAITSWRYRHLTRGDLYILLYYSDESLSRKLNVWYNLQINF